MWFSTNIDILNKSFDKTKNHQKTHDHYVRWSIKESPNPLQPPIIEGTIFFNKAQKIIFLLPEPKLNLFHEITVFQSFRNLPRKVGIVCPRRPSRLRMSILEISHQWGAINFWKGWFGGCPRCSIPGFLYRKVKDIHEKWPHLVW